MLEDLASSLLGKFSGSDVRADSKAQQVEALLKEQFDLRIRTLPAEIMVGQRRSLDRHSNRVFVSVCRRKRAVWRL